jgi:inosine-uridine nucleoside N-ribohydrolase
MRVSFSVLLAVTSAVTVSGTKVILDNDWSPAGFIPYLLALNAGWDVLGLIGDTANSWSLQTSLHGLATLERGNLSSCIPVYRGADYPLLNTPKLFQAWETVHGVLAWQGAFAPENLTAEAEGSDPTSGNPNRVSKSAFLEGYPNTTIASGSAAIWLVEQVNKYPGEVVIYSGGALTNIALAVRMDSTFASKTKGLVVMGGYIDVNLLQVSGSVMQADYNSDVRCLVFFIFCILHDHRADFVSWQINLMIDPEASKIALTADFPNISK